MDCTGRFNPPNSFRVQPLIRQFLINKAINKKGYLLSLGDIRETAEVMVNGHNLGKVWCIPYQVYLPAAILQQGK
jgi:hypothetical protein